MVTAEQCAKRYVNLAASCLKILHGLESEQVLDLCTVGCFDELHDEVRVRLDEIEGADSYDTDAAVRLLDEVANLLKNGE